ncbi:MAG: hypothetical protein OSA92_08250 [Pirellulaceae bacterium]|jgi:hypothetical protein|nr:hypothetical protein [Pirellulaceae bacterium]|tara:strand:- start:1094 stop:1483 length:390 start_codon:yes stop_codon:yes gene_type:complete
MHAPNKKNLDVLQKGSSRYQLIGELGPPVYTDSKNGITTDVFIFEQGHSDTAKYLRAAGYGVAAMYTIGLSEIFSPAIEGNIKYYKIQAEVQYDQDQQVSLVKLTRDGIEIPAMASATASETLSTTSQP